MAPNPESTRQQLIAAAEVLFAARGIDGVSLREINTTAGQKNSTALQYHFADRRGLLLAVLAKHHGDIDSRRHALLDDYERVGVDDLWMLADALVRPSAAKLHDADGGRAYLRIHAQLVSRSDLPASDERWSRNRDSVYRWRQLVGPLLPDVAVRRLHHRFTAIRTSATELARRAAAAPRRDDRLFVSHVTDLVTAVLTAPPSARTTALLEERGRAQSGS